jgi:quinone-modifying oxidoreductase subunit QmoC
MRNKVNFRLKRDLHEFGIKGDFDQCFNCGTCTAICPQVEDGGFIFPRKSIRYIQMGLEDKLTCQIEPWLCYYCGDCSDTCPRDAKPGELMMALRRYLISVYDWTGLGRKIYTSKMWEFCSLLVVALIVLVFLVLIHNPLTTELTADGGVKLNVVFPKESIHVFDLIMGAVLAAFLLSNIFNMYLKVIIKDKSVEVPLKLYITEFFSLIWHFVSQWRFRNCKDKGYWLFHWLLMSGYVLLFTMILLLGNWFLTDNIYPWWHPQRILGYYATFCLLICVGYFLYERIRKVKQYSKYSHVSDWTFLVLLFLTGLTGILAHIFRIYGFPLLTYYIYAIHLIIAIPMLVIEVPFSKWSHLAYRPFAVYFANLKSNAQAQAHITLKDDLKKIV